MSGINLQPFLYCLGAHTFFYLKGINTTQISFVESMQQQQSLYSGAVILTI
jgi:hypothetical protein